MNYEVYECLFKAMIDSIKAYKDIDNEFISKILEIVTDALRINDYLKGERIVNKPWNRQSKIEAARYSYISRIVKINLQTLLEYSLYRGQILGLNRQEVIYYLYSQIISNVVHELTHAYELKEHEEGKLDIEGLVISSSFSQFMFFKDEEYFEKLLDMGLSEREIYEYVKSLERTYNATYQYNPLERLAEYNAHNTMAEIFKILGTEMRLSYYECYMLCSNFLKGYQKGLVPARFYLSQIDSLSNWERIKTLAMGEDLTSRLSLGLPISKEEYASLEDTTTSLYNGLFRS